VIRRLGSAALAAVALAGAVAAIVPQHGASLALLAGGTIVVVAAVFVLVLAGPLVTGGPPRTVLDIEPSGGAPALEPHGLSDARRDLAARTAPGSVPAAVADRLAAAGIPATAGAGGRSDPAAVAAIVHRLLDGEHLAPDGGPR
jgi:hypothetical protein